MEEFGQQPGLQDETRGSVRGGFRGPVTTNHEQEKFNSPE